MKAVGGGSAGHFMLSMSGGAKRPANLGATQATGSPPATAPWLRSRARAHGGPVRPRPAIVNSDVLRSLPRFAPVVAGSETIGNSLNVSALGRQLGVCHRAQLGLAPVEPARARG